MRPSASTEPRSLIVGAKPALPMKNHISVEELFHFLNPGFEEFTDAEGKRKIGKKAGWMCSCWMYAVGPSLRQGASWAAKRSASNPSHSGKA